VNGHVRSGEVEQALDGYLGGLVLDDEDPRVLVVAMARTLARALDERASATAVRELRACLTMLEELAPEAPREVGREELRRLLAPLIGGRNGDPT
jgi:hypothetical protein